MTEHMLFRALRQPIRLGSVGAQTFYLCERFDEPLAIELVQKVAEKLEKLLKMLVGIVCTHVTSMK